MATYQLPPQPIIDLIDAPPTPGVSLSPKRRHILLLDRPSLPTIEEVSAEEVRLAGIRINPNTNGSSRSSHYNGIRIKEIYEGKEVIVSGLPESACIENLSWSPDGKNLAFTLTENDGLYLWIADTKEGRAHQLTDQRINDAMPGLPYRWFPDSRQILYKAIPKNRGEPPQRSTVPSGPVIQENTNKTAPVRTFQDLLKNVHDEHLFEYYTSSQLLCVDVENGTTTPFGDTPGIINGISISPDGNYVLLLRIHRPFSYLVPYSRFPFEVILLDRQGKVVKKIADIPMAEDIPKGFGAVRKGPRSFQWRSDHPATLYWVVAQDEGDPRKEKDIRDKLYCLSAPFEGEAKECLSFSLRYGGIDWGSPHLAIAYEWWWSNRRLITSTWQPDAPEKGKVAINDRSWEDRYNDPGVFETTLNQYGRSVLLTANNETTLFLRGQGASPEGNQPFVDKYDIKTGKTTRLWQSEAPYYESPITFLDRSKEEILTRRESREVPPNFFIRNLKDKRIHQITTFKNPYKALESVQKELIRYKRSDGIELTGTLYLPAGYKKETDGPLPVLMWAYPREFKRADAAGQMTLSPYEFIRINWASPLFWVTQGYAVFDDFGMPIIGEGEKEPNETFITQLVESARAGIEVLAKMGVADPKRIAVGGHSYGAFMTANLLAHSDLFAAGIARSGAYNRTLTPFGFQSEERTFWESPKIYYNMSPFMHADKIKAPLLLIHGEADNNPGTFPMQSERMYGALKGHGATVRLVMLPAESHSYRARASIMHMLWEITTWLDKFVKKKNQKPEEDN